MSAFGDVVAQPPPEPLPVGLPHPPGPHLPGLDLQRVERDLPPMQIQATYHRHREPPSSCSGTWQTEWLPAARAGGVPTHGMFEDGCSRDFLRRAYWMLAGPASVSSFSSGTVSMRRPRDQVDADTACPGEQRHLDDVGVERDLRRTAHAECGMATFRPGQVEGASGGRSNERDAATAQRPCRRIRSPGPVITSSARLTPHLVAWSDPSIDVPGDVAVPREAALRQSDRKVARHEKNRVG